ncbi:DUF551 domain-containing protein [Salmonella enterica subsp. enterica serovar Give]|nr:hypothetical protein [Salmonella enterica subsp. enterica serovar Typhimurium]
MTTITKEQAQEIIDAADEVITALAGTNEDVHPDNSQEMIRLYDDLNDHYAPPEVVRELARIALVSLTAEPVAYNQVQRYMMKDIIVRKMGGNLAGEKLVMDDIHAVTMALIDAGFRAFPPAPVVPDGWISCSERMPEDEQEVIVQNKFGYRYVSYFDEHSGLFFNMPGGNQMNCIEHILVTHWMPLPAPPQQEVK